MRRVLIAIAALVFATPIYAQGLPGSGGSGSGSVTSIATSCGVSGGTITTSGTITANLTQIVNSTSNPALDSYCGQQVNLSYSAGAKNPTLVATATNGAGWWTIVCNIAANTATIAPASGTIGGAANYVLAAGTAAAPSCVQIAADVTNTDYKLSFVPSTGGGWSNPYTMPGSATFSGSDQVTFSTTFPTFTATKQLAFYTGAGVLPASSNNGDVSIGADTSYGLVLAGKPGVALLNSSGAVVCNTTTSVGKMSCSDIGVYSGAYNANDGTNYYPLISIPGNNNGGGTTVAATGPFGSAAPTPVGVSTGAFQITVGTSPSGTDGTMTFAQAAKNFWACDAQDITTSTVTIKMNTTGRSTTVQHFTFSATPTASDILVFKCMAY